MIAAHGVTHPGRVRKSNEDAFVIDEALGLYLVADGMGGHSAGEVAAKIAVETVRAFLTRSHDGRECTWPFGIQPEVSYDANRLVTAIRLANRRVFKAADSHDDYTGMGSTVVAALVQDNRLVYSGVGDSRLYAWREGKLSQLTEDDSWIATVLAREQDVDAEAMASHPMRHVLTNVLGATEETEVSVKERLLRRGDVLLLCSDGVHGALEDTALESALSGDGDAEAMTQGIVDAVLELGEFNWSSQHLDDEVLRCRDGNGDGQTEQVGLRCVRLVGRRQRGGRSSNGSGRRSRGGCRVRRPLCPVACRRPWVVVGSVRAVVCRRSAWRPDRLATCPWRSGKRSRSCERRAPGCVTLPVGSGEPRRLSRESYVATRRLGAAVWRIGRRLRSGTAPDVPSARR